MSGMRQQAEQFFEACDGGGGWEACKAYCHSNATFSCQAAALADVSTIDSSGIGELVSAYTSVTNRGGALRLLHLPPKVQDILQITQLVTVFDVLDDEEEAVASFEE